MHRGQSATIGAPGRRVLGCIVVRPEYSGKVWVPLPRLAAGVDALAELLRDHGVEVVQPPVAVPEDAHAALADEAPGAAALVVYVGGHGMLEGEEHYTAVDSSTLSPGPGNALWTRQLALILAGRGCDVVLLIDTCFAGESIAVVEQALRATAVKAGGAAFGLVAACRAVESIGDGTFVEVLLALLRNGPQHDLGAWGPNDATIRLGALVGELYAAGLPVTEVSTNRASELRLLPNPNHRPEELEGRVDVKLRLRRLGRGADAHLLAKSEGFVGRARLRAAVAAWLETTDQGMFVVTGGPGTGKSALMGILARESVGDPDAAAPEGGPCLPQGTFDAFVHARQKTLEQVVDEVQDFVAAGRGTLLVDALDEAVSGQSIGIAAHLRTLAEGPGMRIVVGTRSSPAVGTPIGGEDPLLSELEPHTLVDLDRAHDAESDIRHLLFVLLTSAEGSPYAGTDVAELVAEVASRTTPSFLLAQTVARWLIGQPEPITNAADWRAQVARLCTGRTIGSLVDDDLASRFRGPDLVRARDLVRALAWCEGLGLPRYSVWPALAEVLSPTLARYGDSDVTWLLREAGWYLTEAGEDGQTVYRLFHQAVTDWFREATLAFGTECEVQGRIAERLLAITALAGGWSRADPYVLHFLIAHAAQAVDDDDVPPIMVGELLDDLQFVARADALRLGMAVVRFRGRVAGVTARLVERCVHEFPALTAGERVALVYLVAQQEQLPPPELPVDEHLCWTTSWVAWQPSAAHVVLAGHGAGVNAVAFSPDGVTVASGSDDGTARLWDARTGAQLRTLVGHGDWVNGVAFSPDGRTVGSAGEDGTVRLWDVGTGALVRCLSGHVRGANAVSFSPDGSTLVTCGDDGTVRLWDASSGQEIHTSRDHAGGVTGARFSPDGASTASSGHDGTVRLWDAYTGREVIALSGHAGWVTGLNFSPDARTIASTGEDGTVRLWDRRHGHQVLSLPSHQGWVTGAAFSPDGRTVSSAGDSGKVRLWDSHTGKPIASFAGHDEWVWTTAFSPDGGTVASASYDGTVRLWDALHRGQLDDVVGHLDWVNDVALSFDGRTVASAGQDRSIRVWDADSGEQRCLAGHAGAVRAVAFSPDDATIASGGEDCTVRLWSAASGAHLLTLDGHEDWVNGVAFSPDGRALATASDDGTIRLWDPVAGRLVCVLAGHDDWVSAVAFSPDGAWLASAGEDGTVRVWERSSGYEWCSLAGHLGGVNDVVFSPDGSSLASAGEDGTLRLWDVGRGRQTSAIDSHDGGARGLAFSADGVSVASAGYDRCVRVWNVESGQTTLTIPFRSTLTSVAWRGSRLAVSAAAGVALVELRC